MILPSSHSPSGNQSAAGNEGGSVSPTVTIAAITGKTQTKAKLPTHTEVKDAEGLDRDSDF